MTEIENNTVDFQENVTDAQSSVKEEKVVEQPKFVKREKTFTQEDVNNAYGSAKQKYYEMGKKEAVENKTISKENTQSDKNFLTKKDLDNYFEERAQKEAYYHQELEKKAEEQRILDAFHSASYKLDKAKEKYPDLEEVFNKTNSRVNFRASDGYKDVLLAANNVDNTADVLYNLYQNEHNLIRLAFLTPEGIEQEIKQLSENIKKEEVASKRKIPDYPHNESSSSSQARRDSGSNDTLSMAEALQRFKK